MKSKRQKGGGSTRKTIKIRTRKKNHSVAPFCGGANRVGRVVAPLQNGLGIGRPIVCFFFCFCSFWRDQNGEKGRGAGKIGKKLGKKIRKKNGKIGMKTKSSMGPHVRERRGRRRRRCQSGRRRCQSGRPSAKRGRRRPGRRG